MIVLLGTKKSCRYSSVPIHKRRFTWNSFKHNMSRFFDLEEVDWKGEKVSFAETFSEHVTFGINVASEWGKTQSGYEVLSKLSKIDGVKIALFPCNQFGSQENGSDPEIHAFALSKGLNESQTIVFSKADVNGPNTRPTYLCVKEATGMGNIKWNFAGQFIVDKMGSITKVDDILKVEALVRELL